MLIKELLNYVQHVSICVNGEIISCESKDRKYCSCGLDYLIEQIEKELEEKHAIRE